ncbi:MAG TPA: aminoglycoside phosphotransferase family protein [Stackebrandtia sp.]|jgi:streptomycin 6-kinase|uniref:aminoglycoside phosphotransferase family protein n=1 Tax=Stackebrandtia sp. TaxID=2023065 RepID=UPI002D36E6E8|nr:aminoglycoside phosphotransferase family protein [Stackebrandtia sp.]HZE41636.1 aminoglycoside phosphotransferase family protein [Stackebrandtia sp.]
MRPADDFELVPDHLTVVRDLGQRESVKPWLAELPTMIRHVRDAFGLKLFPPMDGGYCSWVAPAETPDGAHVVVKITWPHREMYGEADALRAWRDHGAVEVVDADPMRHALILRRCEPGLPLDASPLPALQRLEIACAALRRLWDIDASALDATFETAFDITNWWADEADERAARIAHPFDGGLIAEGIDHLRTLPSTASRGVLLHGDYNPGNLLSDADGRWTVIDPKPMIGDPAFDPWPLVRQIDDPFDHADTAAVLRDRLRFLADQLDLDADRIRAWGIGHAVSSVLFDLDGGDPAEAEAFMREADILARLRL